ncbi:methionine synthase reductase-like [Clavelina lepadiformis]|uniref:Methionine synthase reductase n=1 Tax=Clavelina lepadiformis TaxID=159417 RepID=A0ABP0F2D6_CLALP
MTTTRRKIVVLYGSQTGQAETIANGIHEDAVYNNYDSNVFCLKEEGKEFVITDVTCVIFVCSTTGDGDPPENARKFIRSINRKSLSETHLSKLNYALLGLGDTNYSTFCGGPKKLEKALKQRGAKSFFKTAYADDGTDLEDTVEPWIEGLWPALDVYFSSLGTMPNNVMVRNVQSCETVNHTRTEVNDVKADMENLALSKDKIPTIPKDDPSTSSLLSNMTSVDSSQSLLNSFETEIPSNEMLNMSSAPFPGSEELATITLSPLSKQWIGMRFVDAERISLQSQDFKYQNGHSFPLATSETILTKLVEAKQLTRDDAVKIAMEITLKTEDQFPYQPGDSISVCCENPKEEVDWLISRLSLNDVADNAAEFFVLPNSSKKATNPCPYVPRIFTIRYAFTYCIEIRSVPKKMLLRSLAEYTTDQSEIRRLQELSSKQGGHEYVALIREKNVCILDLLAAFKTCSPSFELLVQHLPRLMPRRYSLINSPLVSKNHLSFAFNVVKFEKDIGRMYARDGICTGFLHNLGNASSNTTNQNISQLPSIKVFRTKSTGFCLPTDTSPPLVMIGPGTGVAPFIGFLRHLEALSAQTTDRWLFYGCRHKDRDYLYKDELESYLNKGILSRLLVAFSRDPTSSESPKYVQDNLKLHSLDIANLLFQKRAIFYVCGDARNMAKDVRQCIIEIITKERNCSDKEAVDLFKQVLDEKRYREDIWA